MGDGLKVFITGITGTLGTALAELHLSSGDTVTGCARNAAAIVRWTHNHAAEVLHRDAGDLPAILPVDTARVYHCAALKHVDVCERDPEAAVRNNLGVMSAVLEACRVVGADLVYAGTDKACCPQNVYAMTKRLAEEMVLARKQFVVRLGNLIGSAGSVIDTWRRCVANGEPLRVTDPTMTRYFIAPRDAAALLARVADCSYCRGRVVVPKMRSARIGDIATRLSATVTVVGSRPGEVQHETLMPPGAMAESLMFHIGGSIGDCLVLGCGNPYRGLSSETADPWDIDALLQEAAAVCD